MDENTNNDAVVADATTNEAEAPAVEADATTEAPAEASNEGTPATE